MSEVPSESHGTLSRGTVQQLRRSRRSSEKYWISVYVWTGKDPFSVSEYYISLLEVAKFVMITPH